MWVTVSKSDKDSPNSRISLTSSNVRLAEAKSRWDGSQNLYKQKETQQVELIEWIIQDENIDRAIEVVKSNKGAPGIDNMTVFELDEYFSVHRDEIKDQIRHGSYKPSPVRRVYIPKPNGKHRPLGIPTVVDRVVQQAVAQVLSLGYDKYFSVSSNLSRYRQSPGLVPAVSKRRYRK